MSNRHRSNEELEFNKTVGANIKFLRKRKKLNQTKVGQAIGTTFQQIQKYEKGSNGISSIKLKLIADKFNVSMDVLADPMMIPKYARADEGFNNEHNQG
jgi:transcriptional regulator with XRE-family HTH domain